jgi:tetratricopeptide (TPR) repeat protein
VDAPVPGESWATARAREYVRTAERHERRGDAAYAILAYSEAIGIDGTFGPAYLGLARLREAIGDVSEAERLYAGATRLESVAAEALARRARMRKRLGREQEAFADLEAATRLEPHARERLRELAGWYAERRVWPAALSVWRRLLTEAARIGDENELAQARVQVRALSLLAADADPVRAGAQDHPSWVRRSIANIARRP